MNVSEFDTCDDVGEPGFVPDHCWLGSAGVGHHICDCEESVRSEIWDELGAMSGAVAGGCEGGGGGADAVVGLGGRAGPIGWEYSPSLITTSLKTMGNG